MLRNTRLQKLYLFVFVFFCVASTQLARADFQITSDGIFIPSIAIEGNIIVAGGYLKNSARSYGWDGRASIYERKTDETWKKTQELFAKDEDPNYESRFFGNIVTIDDETIVVGATAATYVFEIRDDKWQEVQKIRLAGPIAIDGEFLVIGVPREHRTMDVQAPCNSEVGAVYVFKRARNGTWQQTQRLLASDAANFDKFGASVAISGDSIFVGAPQHDGLTSNRCKNTRRERGAVYVFTLGKDNTWSESQIITATNSENNGKFGSDIAADGNTVLIRGNVIRVRNHGTNNVRHFYGISDYIFERAEDGTWHEELVLPTIIDGSTKSIGGMDVNGDTIAIARNSIGRNTDEAISEYSYSTYPGRGVFLFERNDNGSWNEIQALSTNQKGGTITGDDGSCLASGIAVDDKAIVCAAFKGAYVFEKGADGMWYKAQSLAE